MLIAKRKPATSGEILVEEFMKPIGLTQGALADARCEPKNFCRWDWTGGIMLIPQRSVSSVVPVN
jgi:hypothetical protein